MKVKKEKRIFKQLSAYPKMKKDNSGQAMIVLMFVTIIVVTLVLQVTTTGLSSLSLDNEYSEGLLLSITTEGVLEDTAIKYLRNPSYSGETVNLNGSSCTSQVNDVAEGKEMLVFCQKNQRVKTMALTATYNDGAYDFSPVEER